MIKYPVYFHAEAKSQSGKNTLFEAQAEDFPPIVSAVPKEFGGVGGGYSPEDLYILSVITCFIATFKIFAEKGGLAFSEIHGKGKLTIERGKEGIPELTKLDLVFSLQGIQDENKAHLLLAEAEKYCMISNAIKSEKSFSYQFSA